MSTTSSFYVTTPLYYVNDKPHIGHAYTTIAADAIHRWNLLHNRSSFFLTGTDEHGQKVFDAAKKRGLSPKEHADTMVEPFKALWTKLDIQYNDFIRTTEERHTSIVQSVLQKLWDNGDIYENYYEGWYSTAAERFWTEKDLVDGKCPDTGLAVEWIKEKNYFFKMSKYAPTLQQWIEDHPSFIQPESRKNEVIGYLRKDIGDLCISRPKERLSWGIPLPFDANYVTYVWFDALLNYISAIGYNPNGSSEQFANLWPASYQLVGKDILTTHAVYWSTMLFALGLEPAECLYAHGWWTVEGQKMSKSLGNVVDPHLLIDGYGSDAIRYFLLRQISFGVDGNFSHDDLLIRYNADLANGIGNLYQRAIGLLQNSHQGLIPTPQEPSTHDQELAEVTKKYVAEYCQEFEKLQFFHAFDALQLLIQKGNQYIQIEEPWKLMKTGQVDRCGEVLRNALELCRICAWLLSPVMPNKAQELLQALNVNKFEKIDTLDGLTTGTKTSMGQPLFPKMKDIPENIKSIRDQALGQALDTANTTPKDTSKTPTPSNIIKIDVFQSIPFQSGVITKVQEKDGQQVFSVSIGNDTTLEITDSTKISELANQSLVGLGVVVAGPSSKEKFAPVELRIGQIIEAQKHPEADKLLALKVDLGEEKPRSIVAGIANRFSPEQVLQQKVTVVANLKPSKLRGIESAGMLMAAGGERLQALVTPYTTTALGSQLALFGSGEYFLLQVRDGEKHYLQTLSESTEPGSVVR